MILQNEEQAKFLTSIHEGKRFWLGAQLGSEGFTLLNGK